LGQGPWRAVAGWPCRIHPPSEHRRCSTATVHSAANAAMSPRSLRGHAVARTCRYLRIVRGYGSRPLLKSMGPNGYGTDGYCGPETTGGELTIFTWPGRWHIVELPLAVQ